MPVSTFARPAELPAERLDEVFMVPANFIERHHRAPAAQSTEEAGPGPSAQSQSAARAASTKAKPGSNEADAAPAHTMSRREEQAYNIAVLGETCTRTRLSPVIPFFRKSELLSMRFASRR